MACRAAGERRDGVRPLLDDGAEQARGFPVRCRENREQDCGDRGGAERCADRAGELHHGRAGAEQPRPGHRLHCDLDHAHDACP